MTPYIQAMRLYTKFQDQAVKGKTPVKAKKAAIICVDEIIEVIKLQHLMTYEFIKYWESVKVEIINL